MQVHLIPEIIMVVCFLPLTLDAGDKEEFMVPEE